MADANAVIVIDSNPNVALIDGRRYMTSRIDEAPARITITLPTLDGESEAAIRRLSAQRGQIHVVYGNTAHAVMLDDVRLTHESGVTATIVARVSERQSSSMLEISSAGLSADDIAKLRAARILFNDTPPPRNVTHAGDITESLVRGGMHGTLAISESPIPQLLTHLPRDNRATWESIRLLLILQLHLSATVEHVELLRLTVRSGRLVRIEFRGQRPKHYSNQAPSVIELDRNVDF